MKLGITGHQDLPSDWVDWITREICQLIVERAPLTGLSCLAKGADQVFAACILEAGQSLEAVIPCLRYIEAFEEDDQAAYLALLAQASTTVTLDFEPPTETAFLAAGKYIVNRVDHLIAVWDGQSAQGAGGTADIVAYARAHDVPVTIIWPAGVSR